MRFRNPRPRDLDCLNRAAPLTQGGVALHLEFFPGLLIAHGPLLWFACLFARKKFGSDAQRPPESGGQRDPTGSREGRFLCQTLQGCGSGTPARAISTASQSRCPPRLREALRFTWSFPRPVNRSRTAFVVCVSDRAEKVWKQRATPS